MNFDKSEIFRLIKESVHETDPDAEVIVYGSRARGDEHQDSDWDILILTNYTVAMSREREFMHKIFKLEMSTGEPFSTAIYNKEDWNGIWNNERYFFLQQCNKGRNKAMTSEERNAYIEYQVEKSREALKAAEILAENKLWTSVLNRLYYACFHIVNGLMVANKIETKTHSGIKNQFSLHFVKTGIVDESFGVLFYKLFNWRHKGDYGGV